MLRRVSLIDSGAHGSVFVDDERYAAVNRAFLGEDAVAFARLVLRPVAEQGELQLQVFAEVVRRCERVDADAQNLDTGRDEVVLYLSEAVEFVCSATGESERIERQHNRLFAEVIGQVYFAALAVRQRELQGAIAHLNCHECTSVF